jgi:hypothetical protein
MAMNLPTDLLRTFVAIAAPHPVGCKYADQAFGRVG